MLSGQQSTQRFTTHPPHKKGGHYEEGSVDTNGFATLKTSSADSDDEVKQQSQSSLADSQITSEEPEMLTYQDVVESVVAGPVLALPDEKDRKNGKAGKQKSRSDPNGDRSRESLDFAPGIESSQSRSAPLLGKDNDDSIVEEFHMPQSDNALSPPPLDLPMESGGEHTSDEEDHLEVESGTGTESSDLLTPSTASGELPCSSAPPTPKNHSPTNTLERSSSHAHPHLLSVPSSSVGHRKPISRSASSASVLQNRKHQSAGRGDRDGSRKFSITTDEAMTTSRSSSHLVPDFTPLSDSNTATSMPVVWKDRLSSTESPEREPGFIKVSFGFYWFLNVKNCIILFSLFVCHIGGVNKS